MDGVRYDPAWLYAGDVMAKKDPFTARMFQRIHEQMQERQKKQNDLKALAAKWLEQEPEPWDIAPLTPLSKEERSFWLDATFGYRYGRGRNG